MFGLGAKEIEEAGATWTMREVLQQPEIWAEVERLIAGEARRLGEFLDPILARPDAAHRAHRRRHLVLHRGMSRAGAAATRAARVDAIPTTDLVASPQSYLSSSTPTLLVSFARSGNSPESIAAVRLADACIEDCAHLIYYMRYRRCSGAGARKHSPRASRAASGAQQRSQLCDDLELYGHAAGGARSPWVPSAGGAARML